MAIARLPVVDHEASVAPSNVTVGADLSRAVRIAAATRTHADGRTRYHGMGRRGRAPAAVVDAKDIVFAIAELERAHQRFVEAQSMEPGSKERRLREREATDLVRLSSSFTDELLDRRRL